MEKILICCINYNNSEEVLKYAKLISEQNSSNEVIMIITDNSNNLEEKQKLKDKINKIKLKTIILDSKINVGYLNGMFLGVKKYYELYKEYPEWTILSNTDIEFVNIDFIKELLEKEYEKDYWCIAPSIFSSNTRSYQNPHYKERIKKSKIDRIIFLTKYQILFNIYGLLSYIKSKLRKKKKEKSQKIYAAHGCFFLLKQDYFKMLKKIKYGAFLYSEEAFIAETIREQNKIIYYDDQLNIIHREHSTTKLLGNKKRAKFINESLIYIRKKFYEVKNGD